jgi:hypothetical protein
MQALKPLRPDLAEKAMEPLKHGAHGRLQLLPLPCDPCTVPSVHAGDHKEYSVKIMYATLTELK